MGLYNYLDLVLRCPRCGIESSMEAEFRFGLQNQDRYHLGDKLQWNGGGVSTPRDRPVGGNYIDEGYVECPNCHQDFWIIIRVHEDVIESAEVDLTRKGYIP